MSGYAYDTIEQALLFSQNAIEHFLKLSYDKTIGLTLTTKKRADTSIRFICLIKGKIIHTQSKVKLFTLNAEDDYFTAGKQEAIQLLNSMA